MKQVLLALLMLLATPVTWAAAAVPPEITGAHQRLSARLAPPVRAWVSQQAVIARQAPPEAAATLTSNAARQRFRGQPLTPQLIDTLVFLVLYESAEIEALPTRAPAAARRGPSSERTSMQLQSMMDRRSKTVALLSNLMKKISTTQDALVQNLK
ncbi:MAG: hypothetical protein EPO25_02005 [Gammaproteobacteria bacterium]|nr:MAG: hypothetical protein EPO25_02005 [Gammaproteobacteria bacterium]